MQVESNVVIKWKYFAEEIKHGLTKIIIQDEQPFIFSKNKSFATCMQTYINPQFKNYSRNTTKNIIQKNI